MHILLGAHVIQSRVLPSPRRPFQLTVGGAGIWARVARHGRRSRLLPTLFTGRPSVRLLETRLLILSFAVRSARDGVAQLPPSALLLDGRAYRQRGGRQHRAEAGLADHQRPDPAARGTAG